MLIVNVIAFSVLIGVIFIIIEINLNIGVVVICSKFVIGLLCLLIEVKEILNNIEINSICKIFFFVSGFNIVVGIIFIKKVIIEFFCVLFIYFDIFVDCSVFGLIFSFVLG